jgi:hypothetical protein
VSVRPTLLLLIVSTLGCNGPFVLLPGGELGGEALTELPVWSSGAYGTAQLETRPEAPYSVNVAYTILGDQLYINAGDTETQWVKNMAADPRVRLRVDGVLYQARAERVTDPVEIASFGEAWTNQSMFRRDPAELEQVWLYRFVAR